MTSGWMVRASRPHMCSRVRVRVMDGVVGGVVEGSHTVSPILDGRPLCGLPTTDLSAPARMEKGACSRAFACCACRPLLSLGEHGPRVLSLLPQPFLAGRGVLVRRQGLRLRAR